MKLRNLFIFLLVVKAVLCFNLIRSEVIGLAPDEAQYWTWSQALDWGYYSKPPAIAWQIHATTFLFGNTELGVRAGALIIGFLIPLFIYFLGRRAGLNEQKSFWAGLLAAFSPWGVFLSMMATTDPGVILFITLATFAVISGPKYILAGVAIFFGALFKWTAFAFWPFVFIFLIFFPHLRKRNLLVGLFISLLALLPTLYWNGSHEWATFKHVAGSPSKGGNFFDFLGAQAATLSPLLFILLIFGLYKMYRRSPSWGLLFCAALPTGVALYLILALFSKMQPNWAVYLYPTAFIVIAWAFSYRWLKIGFVVSLLTVIVILLLPFLPLPYKLNPFRQNVGWKNLKSVLLQAGFKEGDSLFADKYQTTSLLSFYGPSQKRAYFLNLHGRRKNQFSYWEQPLKGATGFFVVAENMKEEAISWHKDHYLELLPEYFAEVEYLGAYPLYSVEKYALLFKCDNYNGKLPKESHLF
jgi:4-amino-4-deoxy-L-arabinose transferase-like glycosyltransferase